MSDSDGDFSDELLELAGASEKKRRKRQGGSKSKRRRAEVTDSEGEAMVESEEDEHADPYPLEGKYKDEADREYLQDLPEFEREEIIAQRLEEMQRLQDKRSLDAMVRMQRKDSGADSDTVAKAAKRQHAVRGATKEKSRKLDELKAKRKAKDDKKRAKGTGGGSSPKRERSSSPDDMEMSSEEDEDGQISRLELEEERDRKLYGRASPKDETLSLELLLKCRLTRDMIAKTCMTPWFEDYVKGAYVRYLIGQEGNQPIYRICEIDNLAPDLCRPYKVNEETVNQNFELRHGKSSKVFPMDKVSNAPFEAREFERWMKVCQMENVALPTRRLLEKKSAQLLKMSSQAVTETDVMKMLEKRRALQSGSNLSGPALTLEKSRLAQARALAARRQDWAEVTEIDAKLAELGSGNTTPANGKPADEDEDGGTRLARVNERNRKANLEAIRKMELEEAERKRMRRKLEGSRTGTPGAANGVLKAETGPPPSAVSDVKPRQKDGFDDTIMDEVDIDLGDF